MVESNDRFEVLFDDRDWHVERAPVKSFGYNEKGTFFLIIVRTSVNGSSFDWHMNIPEIKLGKLPQILGDLDEDKLSRVRFTGGWSCGMANVKLELAPVEE